MQILEKLVEHNTWANLKLIEACAKLPEHELDAPPASAAVGSIRRTLSHLVGAEKGYLSLLTLAVEERVRVSPSFEELAPLARETGDGLLRLVREGLDGQASQELRTTDGYRVETWVVVVQVINHATEHREQVKAMLSAAGIEPPDLDSWTFAAETGALAPIDKGRSE